MLAVGQAAVTNGGQASKRGDAPSKRGKTSSRGKSSPKGGGKKKSAQKPDAVAEEETGVTDEAQNLMAEAFGALRKPTPTDAVTANTSDDADGDSRVPGPDGDGMMQKKELPAALASVDAQKQAVPPAEIPIPPVPTSTASSEPAVPEVQRLIVSQLVDDVMAKCVFAYVDEFEQAQIRAVSRSTSPELN